MHTFIVCTFTFGLHIILRTSVRFRCHCTFRFHGCARFAVHGLQFCFTVNAFSRSLTFARSFHGLASRFTFRLRFHGITLSFGFRSVLGLHMVRARSAHCGTSIRFTFPHLFRFARYLLHTFRTVYARLHGSWLVCHWAQQVYVTFTVMVHNSHMVYMRVYTAVHYAFAFAVITRYTYTTFTHVPVCRFLPCGCMVPHGF